MTTTKERPYIANGLHGQMLIGKPCPKCGNIRLLVGKPDYWIAKTVRTISCYQCGWQKDASIKPKPIKVPEVTEHWQVCGSNPTDNPNDWQLSKMMGFKTRCDNHWGQ